MRAEQRTDFCRRSKVDKVVSEKKKVEEKKHWEEC
jgi:hypothetical protein